MPSAQLEAHAARDVPEARIRELALAKAKTQQAYNAVYLIDTRDFNDDQLVDHEIAVTTALRACLAAAAAFNKAI